MANTLSEWALHTGALGSQSKTKIEPKWRIGGVPTSRVSFRPTIRFPSEADCQFQHLSKNGGVEWIRTTTRPCDPYWRFSKPLPYQIRLTTPKMAEEENFEISHGLATATSGFQDRPLAFRVTLPSWRKGGVLKPYTGFPPLLAVFEAASLPLGLPFQKWWM